MISVPMPGPLALRGQRETDNYGPFGPVLGIAAGPPLLHNRYPFADAYGNGVPYMARQKKKADKKPNGNGGNLGFEAKMWALADKLRGHMQRFSSPNSLDLHFFAVSCAVEYLQPLSPINYGGIYATIRLLMRLCLIYPP